MCSVVVRDYCMHLSPLSSTFFNYRYFRILSSTIRYFLLLSAIFFYYPLSSSTIAIFFYYRDFLLLSLFFLLLSLFFLRTCICPIYDTDCCVANLGGWLANTLPPVKKKFVRFVCGITRLRRSNLP
ncbi:hypothetical protein GGI42DRAFT_190053 [Trichoderma sp. SZMC 28013]